MVLGIRVSEEIYASYDMCRHCGDKKESYGTPEIMRDYGFVEEYPQRWVFEGKLTVGFGIDEVLWDVGEDAESGGESPSLSWIGHGGGEGAGGGKIIRKGLLRCMLRRAIGVLRGGVAVLAGRSVGDGGGGVGGGGDDANVARMEDVDDSTLASKASSVLLPLSLTNIGRAPLHYACLSFRGLGVDYFQVLLNATIEDLS